MKFQSKDKNRLLRVYLDLRDLIKRFKFKMTQKMQQREMID